MAPSDTTPTPTSAKDDVAARNALVAQAVDGTHSPVMLIDRDLVVTYVNRGTLELFRRHADTFAARYPGFDPERVLGACIDVFHKDPSHQRRLLADPRNMPHTARMQVGPLHFQLHITCIHDARGEYVGNTLEWMDVTESVRLEAERAQMQQRATVLTQAVKTASTPMMMIDRDFVITFVNDATVALMGRHERQMREIFPGFEAKGLVGRNIDMFHKHPEHQRKLLSDPRNLPHTARISVGELRFELNVTAVIDEKGEYIGNTLQWSDVTEQMDVEEQIRSLIERAAAGQLDERLQAEAWTGFLASAGAGVNMLLDAVVHPIQETREVVSALAEGDLTREANADSQGEFRELADALNRSISKLREIVGQIRVGAADITRGAGEINEGNNNLSARTQEQAAALEETAATVEELTATVKQNADNALHANQLASGARELAEKGGSVVSEAVSAMGEINSSSKKIADIISVIDEIAFQTNLLALNAAVEAARAGEQGRGFAVVATEVRNLAQRSAGAAKEIKLLIKDSVEKVEHGSKLVDRSGSTLQEIMGAVKKVSDIVAEIAAASEEQASGIEQVNQAVAQMDQATQQNAALVEEAAAASASMDEQAQSLERIVRFFHTGEGEAEVQEEPSRPRTRRASPAAERRPRPTTYRAPKAAPLPAAKASNDSDEWEEF